MSVPPARVSSADPVRSQESKPETRASTQPTGTHSVERFRLVNQKDEVVSVLGNGLTVIGPLNIAAGSALVFEATNGPLSLDSNLTLQGGELGLHASSGALFINGSITDDAPLLLAASAIAGVSSNRSTRRASREGPTKR